MFRQCEVVCSSERPYPLSKPLVGPYEADASLPSLIVVFRNEKNKARKSLTPKQKLLLTTGASLSSPKSQQQKCDAHRC